MLAFGALLLLGALLLSSGLQTKPKQGNEATETTPETETKKKKRQTSGMEETRTESRHSVFTIYMSTKYVGRAFDEDASWKVMD